MGEHDQSQGQPRESPGEMCSDGAGHVGREGIQAAAEAAVEVGPPGPSCSAAVWDADFEGTPAAGVRTTDSKSVGMDELGPEGKVKEFGGKLLSWVFI